MSRSRNQPTPQSGASLPTWLVAVRWARRAIALACGALLLSLALGLYPAPAGQVGQARPADHVALDILPVKPGGPPQNYASYVPATSLTVPAHSLVTVTVRNFDLDASPAPAGFPYAQVQGTIGRVAYADGTAYASLDRMNIAHTFTIPQLHVNVPIPGHIAAGKTYVTVTFSFRTGASGRYDWGCFAPCGDGQGGLGGPMADEAYMRGTLLVES